MSGHAGRVILTQAPTVAGPFADWKGFSVQAPSAPSASGFSGVTTSVTPTVPTPRQGVIPSTGFAIPTTYQGQYLNQSARY